MVENVGSNEIDIPPKDTTRQHPFAKVLLQLPHDHILFDPSQISSVFPLFGPGAVVEVEEEDDEEERRCASYNTPSLPFPLIGTCGN